MKERGASYIWLITTIFLLISGFYGFIQTIAPSSVLYNAYAQDQMVLQADAVEKSYRDEQLPNLALRAERLILNATNNSIIFNITNYGGATAKDLQVIRFEIFDENGIRVGETKYIRAGISDLSTNKSYIRDVAQYNLTDIERPIKVGETYRIDAFMMWYTDKGKSFVETESAYVSAVS